MISAVPRNSRTMPPRYAKRSERMSGPIRGCRSLVLKIRCTTTLPQVWATFLSPLQGLFPDRTVTQGLRPGLQSCAASRLVELSALRRRGGCDECHNAGGRYFLRSRNGVRRDLQRAVFITARLLLQINIPT